ncbi:CrcB family protein [Sphingomonas sp.]|uniref:fluoride efflux transporter FluC n=1 Tax=Sphingomonas sp. TaxID=28214 RepID=UPI00286B122B|nr:CrcB family protein [Sphingomonas sp.]
MTNPYFLVFVGGGFGSVLRFATYHAARLWLPPSFPWGTLVVNVLGGVAAGALAGWILSRSIGGADSISLFLMTGLLGGFTTFSAFSVDAVLLWQRGEPATAFAYVAASVLLAIGGVVAGMSIVRAFA